MMIIPKITVALLAVFLFPVSASAADNDSELQHRYSACMIKADTDSLDDFRSACDVICMLQPGRNEAQCLERHEKWHTGNCHLSDSEIDRQDQHLERAKDRCLQEFKAGITAPI